MARTKTSTSSATNEKVVKVSGEVGKPNQTVAAIREQYKQDQEKQRVAFDKAMEALKKMKDPNKTSTYNIKSYDRETIRGYLQNIGNSETNLRAAVNYLYYRSQILFRIINWYASIWDLRCRKVTPPIDLSKGLDANQSLKSLNDTLDVLDRYKIHENMYEVLLRCYKDDVCYFLWFSDEEGSFPYILNPDECKITGRYMTGDLAFSIDMSKFRSAQRRELIEWLGEPLSSMIREYDSTGVKYIQVPDEYAGCFKFRIENLDNIIPPMTPILQQLAGLSDLEDIQAIANEQSIFKLLIYPLATLSSAKNSDDFEVSVDLALEYFDAMVNRALPDYVSAAPLPGQSLDVVDFSTTSTDKDIDRLAQAQNNILATAGGGSVLNANYINNTAAFNAWMKSESEFAISSLMPQITGFVNRHLSYELSSPCKVDFFEVTVLTKEDLRKALLESMEYSYSFRLAYGTLCGFSEKETLATLHMEQEILGLQNLMIYPLSSSHTQSNSGEVGQGRDSLPDNQIEPSTERSRNE